MFAMYFDIYWKGSSFAIPKKGGYDKSCCNIANYHRETDIVIQRQPCDNFIVNPGIYDVLV